MVTTHQLLDQVHWLQQNKVREVLLRVKSRLILQLIILLKIIEPWSINSARLQVHFCKTEKTNKILDLEQQLVTS